MKRKHKSSGVLREEVIAKYPDAPIRGLVLYARGPVPVTVLWPGARKLGRARLVERGPQQCVVLFEDGGWTQSIPLKQVIVHEPLPPDHRPRRFRKGDWNAEPYHQEPIDTVDCDLAELRSGEIGKIHPDIRKRHR